MAAPYKYAGNTALQALVTKVEGLLGNKVDKVAGKGLSTNDLTNELKTQYDAAYTHSQAQHAPADAEKNVIIGITVNGKGVTVDPESRKAAITVATKVSELTNDSGFQTASDVSGAITTALEDYYNKSATDAAIATAVQNAAHLKYQIVESLPTQDISTTTIYMVAKEGAEAAGQDIYTEYMYLNEKWEIIGDTSVDLSNYPTKDQMNTAITNALAAYVKATDLVEITADEVNALFTA